MSLSAQIDSHEADNHMAQRCPYLDAVGHPQLRISVAGFIDLLGFSQMSVAESDPTQAQRTLEKIAAAIDDSRRFVRETMQETETPDVVNRLAVKYFSDNLVLGYPFNSDGADAVTAALFVIRCVQKYQLRMSLNGFFIRGGLTQGLLCLTDDIIFGPTLIESYALESKTAIVPRILVTESLQRHIASHVQHAGQQTPHSQDLICRDIDGWWFVNYLQAAICPSGVDWPLVEQHKSSILTSLSGTKRHDVLPKYGWASRYHNVFCHWHRADPGYRDAYRIDRADEQSTIDRLSDAALGGK